MSDYAIADHEDNIIRGGFSTPQEAQQWLSSFKRGAKVIKEEM